MTEQLQDDRHNFSLEGIASSVKTITRLVDATDDGSVRTPTLEPIPFYGNDADVPSLTVNYVSITDLGHMDSAAKVKVITLSEARSETVPGKQIVGLFIENANARVGTPNLRLMTTKVLEGRTLFDTIPPSKEFREATPVEADTFDDQVLYAVAFQLRALVEPWDVPHPEEQVPEVLENLEASRATIPGISYMGQLLIHPDNDK